MISDNNTLLGYPYLQTNQIPGGTAPNNNIVFFGSWSELLIGIWDGAADLIIDPYTLSNSAQVRVVMNQFSDLNCRYEQAFCVSTDAGARSLAAQPKQVSKLAILYDRLVDPEGKEMGESIALSPNLFILWPAEGRERRPREKETLETTCGKCGEPLCTWTIERSVEELPVQYVECRCGFIIGFRGPALELSHITAAWRSFRRAADRALEQVREN